MSKLICRESINLNLFQLILWLIIGFTFYSIYRPGVLPFGISLNHSPSLIVDVMPSIIYGFIVYHLALILLASFTTLRLKFIFVSYLIAVFTELGQIGGLGYLGRGTFDYLDLVCLLICFLITAALLMAELNKGHSIFSSRAFQNKNRRSLGFLFICAYLSIACSPDDDFYSCQDDNSCPIAVYMPYEELRVTPYLDPSAPVEIIGIADSLIFENLLIVVNKYEGIYFYDLSVSNSPEFIGFMAIPLAESIYIENRTLYLQAHRDLLLIELDNLNSTPERINDYYQIPERRFAPLELEDDQYHEERGVLIGYGYDRNGNGELSESEQTLFHFSQDEWGSIFESGFIVREGHNAGQIFTLELSQSVSYPNDTSADIQVTEFHNFELTTDYRVALTSQTESFIYEGCCGEETDRVNGITFLDDSKLLVQGRMNLWLLKDLDLNLKTYVEVLLVESEPAHQPIKVSKIGDFFLTNSQILIDSEANRTYELDSEILYPRDLIAIGSKIVGCWRSNEVDRLTAADLAWNEDRPMLTNLEDALGVEDLEDYSLLQCDKILARNDTAYILSDNNILIATFNEESKLVVESTLFPQN